MRSTSSFDRPEEDVIVIFWSLPVAVSFAVTFRIPLASMSNVPSICGTPRGAGGIPVRWNLPSVRFCAAIGRGREGLRLLGRDRRVARNHRRCDTAQRFNRQRQRSDVEQQQVLYLAL